MAVKTAKPKISNRSLILDTAQELFLSNGYNGTSIRNIADRAKVSLGGIYALFANKEAIFAELLMTKMPFLALADLIQKHQDEPAAVFFRSVAQEWYRILNIKNFRLLFIDWVEFGGNTCKKILPKIFPQKVEIIKNVIKKKIAQKELKKYDPFLIFRAFIQMLTIYIVTDGLLAGFSDTKKPIDDIVNIYLNGILLERGRS